ncbi:hypothetical protein [Mesorhizobium sp. M0220]|uniref:hypothetical protein n=1 Tax=Mesorhizobium sp. M0220 TaxID=2956920 RepID=UPI00333C3488
MKHKTEGKRLTRKLKALGQDAWRLMNAPMLRSTGGSPPFCVDTTATTAGRKLSNAQRIPSANAPDMATVSETAQPEKPAHGLVGVRDPDGALPLPTPRITRTWAKHGYDAGYLRESRVRESARPDL